VYLFLCLLFKVNRTARYFFLSRRVLTKAKGRNFYSHLWLSFPLSFAPLSRQPQYHHCNRLLGHHLPTFLPPLRLPSVLTSTLSIPPFVFAFLFCLLVLQTVLSIALYLFRTSSKPRLPPSPIYIYYYYNFSPSSTRLSFLLLHPAYWYDVTHQNVQRDSHAKLPRSI
jgi:hypothetical protein